MDEATRRGDADALATLQRTGPPRHLGNAASAALLMPQLAAIDLRQAVPAVQVPVYFAAGRHDRLQPPALSRAYFDALQAPAKHWEWFDRAAHFPQWEGPAHFHALLQQVLRDEARPTDQAHAAEPALPGR